MAKIFQQILNEYDLHYFNQRFEYSSTCFSGQRIENGKNIKQKNYKIKELPNDFISSFSPKYFAGLELFLKSANKCLNMNNNNLSAYFKLHDEEVTIDQNKFDIRRFGFIKLVFNNSYNNNIYTSEIPIANNNLDQLIYLLNKAILKKREILKAISYKTNFISLEHTPIIFSPQSAAFFFHETIGHLLESDFFSCYKPILNPLNIVTNLTLSDSIAGYENFVGLNRYDDEGTDIKPVTLIEKGKFVNTLNSYSNYGLNNKLYGTGRRESFKYGIMPRMRFSIIKNVNHISYQQMIAQQSNAFFVNEINFGYISPQEGNYSLLGNGYIIKNGGTTTFVDNLQLTGNIFEDLKNIEQIGDDSQTFCSYCNKINQMVRVGANSPSIRLSNISKLEGIFYGKD